MMWKSLQMPRSFQKVETGEDGRYAKFVVEALERGWGITVGNALRRTLLSSLQGAAIVSVKIAGVEKEFSSIPGVKEDVTEIIMNLKNLAIKNTSSDNEPKTAYIECEGKGVVTAADANLAMRMALSLIEPIAAADANGDGTISIADANIIMRWALNL